MCRMSHSYPVIIDSSVNWTARISSVLCSRHKGWNKVRNIRHIHEGIELPKRNRHFLSILQYDPATIPCMHISALLKIGSNILPIQISLLLANRSLHEIQLGLKKIKKWLPSLKISTAEVESFKVIVGSKYFFVSHVSFKISGATMLIEQRVLLICVDPKVI